MANVQSARSDKTLRLNREARLSVSRTPRQQGQALGAQPFESQNTIVTPPPDRLIQTWAWMWKSAQDPEVSREGKRRLINVFGSIEVAAAYISTLK